MPFFQSKSDFNLFTAAVFPCSEAYFMMITRCKPYVFLAALLVPHMEQLKLLIVSRYGSVCAVSWVVSGKGGTVAWKELNRAIIHDLRS